MEAGRRGSGRGYRLRRHAPPTLWLKGAKADQIARGTPNRHQAPLAELVGLPVS